MWYIAKVIYYWRLPCLKKHNYWTIFYKQSVAVVFSYLFFII